MIYRELSSNEGKMQTACIIGSKCSGKSQLFSYLTYGKRPDFYKVCEMRNKKIWLRDIDRRKKHMRKMSESIQTCSFCIVVVSLAEGEFENGFGKTGSGYKECELAKHLGVSTLIVVLNKLDLVDCNRFTEVHNETLSILNELGFLRHNIKIIPISLKDDINLSYSSKTLWNKGQNLISLLEFINTQEPLKGNGFLMKVTQTYSDPHLFSGHVLKGEIALGNSVYFMASYQVYYISSIEINYIPVEKACKGDLVCLKIEDIRARINFIISSERCGFVSSFICKLLVKVQCEIRPGISATIICDSIRYMCRITEIGFENSKKELEKFAAKKKDLLIAKIKIKSPNWLINFNDISGQKHFVCFLSFAEIFALGEITSTS